MRDTESLLFSPFKNTIHLKNVNKYSYSLQINLTYLLSNYGKNKFYEWETPINTRYPFKKYFWRIQSVPGTILDTRDTMPRKINFQIVTKFPGV